MSIPKHVLNRYHYECNQQTSFAASPSLLFREGAVALGYIQTPTTAMQLEDRTTKSIDLRFYVSYVLLIASKQPSRTRHVSACDAIGEASRWVHLGS